MFIYSLIFKIESSIESWYIVGYFYAGIVIESG